MSHHAGLPKPWAKSQYLSLMLLDTLARLLQSLLSFNTHCLHTLNRMRRQTQRLSFATTTRHRSLNFPIGMTRL